MGTMEKEVARQIRRSKVQNAVLAAVGIGGILAIGLIAPNTLQLLRYLDKGKRRTSNPKYAANRAFWRLVEAGYIILEQQQHGKFARLTPKGEIVLRTLSVPGARLNKPKRWDGKWRVLVFDIREKRRGVRDRLRSTLQHIGFVQLQRSVWVYPYDCEDFILLLKADFHIGTELLYMIVDRIEDDGGLKADFSLA